jgi:hypothetical protein
MQAHYWGLKTFYYSLINKAGSRAKEEDLLQTVVQNYVDVEMDDDCEACKL